MECFRDGNKCSHCLDMAVDSFETSYQDKHPDSDSSYIRYVAENSKLKAVVEESAPLALINCSERQRRARIIGAKLGRII